MPAVWKEHPSMFPRVEWIVPYLPPDQYLIYATVSKEFKRELDRTKYKKKTVKYFPTIELAEWARTNGCPWDERTCAYAADCGHLEVLKWARANGAPWDERTCAYAADGGHLEVLKWARANGAPWDEIDCVALASEGGHLEVIEWVRSNSY